MNNSYLIERKMARKLRETIKYTVPSVLSKGPIFGFGYRSPFLLGNIFQAEVAKKYNISCFLAQQSVREIQRTKRTFQDVIDSASISVFLSDLKLPWGADADHLKQESSIEEAVNAGFTHFTFDLIDELRRNWQAVTDRVSHLYSFTKNLMKKKDFTVEISLDETEGPVKLSNLEHLLVELKRQKIKVDEVAPRFPGYFEKAIDYYWKMDNGKKNKDTKEFEDYLKEVVKLADKYSFRISVHSGSDKFTLYPIISRLTNNVHLKTAGTYYLEELKVVAKHNLALFKEIYISSLKQFQKDRASYELSANLNNVPDVLKLSNEQVVALLTSNSGSDDLRQVLHVTYGSVLTNKELAEGIFTVLKENKDDYFANLSNHLKLHINPFLK